MPINISTAKRHVRWTCIPICHWCSQEAVEDSGLDVENEDLNKSVSFLVPVLVESVHLKKKQVTMPSIKKTVLSSIRSSSQDDFGYCCRTNFYPVWFHGPNYATCSACATSTNAIADAFNLIRLGKANAIIIGGSEAAIAACGVGGFNAMHALSTRNDSPDCIPSVQRKPRRFHHG